MRRAALALCLVLGCSEKHETPAAAAPTSSAGDRDLGRARALASGAPLPDRFEVVALADQLAVGAMPLPKAERSERLLLAAAMRERLYRATHAQGDAREAVALFEQGKEGAAERGACEAEVKRAVLLGELAQDPVATLREVSAIEGRAKDPACAAAAGEVAERLAPYRAKAGYKDAPAPGPAVTPPTAASGTAPPGDDDLAIAEPPPPAKEPVSVTEITPYGDVESARIVVRVSGPTSFAIGQAPPKEKGKGPRVYVDIAKAHLQKKSDRKRKIPVGGLVDVVRMGDDEGKVRVVLDLSKAAYKRVFYLPEPFRVVVDVTTKPPTQQAGAMAGKRAVARVALDPGHGGSDPGAIGPRGLREKDVTLDIAHRAGPVLARELGISALLTRDKDEYVSLEERTQRANAFRADLMVSIHCNADVSGGGHGVQTYVLDTSSDDVAARVAARENAATAQAGAEVAKLLGALRLADTGPKSRHLADLLQRAAMASLSDKFPGVVDGGVKNAGFFVLVGAEMPSALFETSFISNPGEEERLGTAEYRQRLADAIVNAVRAYRDGK